MFNLDSKQIFWKLLNALLFFGVILSVVGIRSWWRYGSIVIPDRTISVSAEGKAVAVPDIIAFSFSAVSEGLDPAELADDNNKIVNSAIDFLKSQGIESKDIKTAGYNLFPKYDYDEKLRRSFISGYELRQTVALKIRDFSKVGAILAALPGYGINEIGSLNFDVEDPEKYLSDARGEAFEKAQAKAKIMAKQNGVSIKRVVSFSESAGGFPPPIPYYEAAFAKGGDVVVAEPPQIEPGTQEVVVQVSVIYELR